jgi:hypothetical protein
VSPPAAPRKDVWHNHVKAIFVIMDPRDYARDFQVGPLASQRCCFVSFSF